MITAGFSSSRHDQVSIFTKQTCQAAAGRHCSPLSLLHLSMTRPSPSTDWVDPGHTTCNNLRDIVSTVLTAASPVWSWQVAGGCCWAPAQNSSALYCGEREWPRTQLAGWLLACPGPHRCTVTGHTGYRTLTPPHRFRFPHTQCISWHFTWILYQPSLISTQHWQSLYIWTSHVTAGNKLIPQVYRTTWVWEK